MRNKSIIFGSLLILTATGIMAILWTPKSAGRLLKNTTSITFTEQGWNKPDKSFTVTDQAEVQRILDTIHLRSKDPCLCDHLYEAVFKKTRGEVRVSFCDHCFDVLVSQTGVSSEEATHYKMPKEFYTEFLRLARSQTNEEWHP